MFVVSTRGQQSPSYVLQSSLANPKENPVSSLSLAVSSLFFFRTQYCTLCCINYLLRIRNMKNIPKACENMKQSYTLNSKRRVQNIDNTKAKVVNLYKTLMNKFLSSHWGWHHASRAFSHVVVHIVLVWADTWALRQCYTHDSWNVWLLVFRRCMCAFWCIMSAVWESVMSCPSSCFLAPKPGDVLLLWIWMCRGKVDDKWMVNLLL